MIDHFSPRARPANFEEHQIVHCASEDEWRWVAVAFQGERRARLRRTGPNALRPVPGQVEPVALNDPHRDRAPHRTSYVCGSFLIDRFWLSVLNAARQHQGKASLAAGDAWRATVPPGSSSEVRLPYSACARRPRARQAPSEETDAPSSRHIPDAIKREVYERDGGRCTFTDERGRRCAETGALQFDHQDGFARTHLHRADRIRLLLGRPRLRRSRTRAPAAATSNRTCGFPAYGFPRSSRCE